ncbi:conserved hypothetical protein [Cupriavidus taiwanensis]|uniref:Minor tail T domain-containing protein n=1 Tax=Cupriavidus taiwanensis TaxID=164546 RepID=A0A375IY18_9BURK|nr:hypothetical protein [Cupriavidus taiwanensis]SPR97349.1 conserved hypothetical protein [Cupriavidus taiwanensis]
MASYQIDQRGGHYDDLRAGAITSVLANIHRDRERQPDPFTNLDFIPWNEHHRAAHDAEPVLLDDPEAQSRLIDQMMFPKRQ